MADKTLTEIGRTCQRTATRLRELQAELYKCGLTAEAADLEPLIKEQFEVAYFCSEDTGVWKRPKL